MRKSKPSKSLLLMMTASVIVTLLLSGLSTRLWADPKPEAPPPKKAEVVASKTNSVEVTAKAKATKKGEAKKQVTGAELYSMHCNRCHPERYPTERTAAQWKTIMLHMRIRANLPAEQSKLILKYLQDNSGR
jgi:hypothetical protein